MKDLEKLQNLTLEGIRERIETHFRERMVPGDFEIKHYVWEEDGQKFSAWKIGNLMTGDGGYEMFLKALHKELK